MQYLIKNHRLFFLYNISQDTDNLPAENEAEEFEDFDYINVDLTPTQEIVMLILIAIYNIGMSIFVVRNKFKNVEDFNF